MHRLWIVVASIFMIGCHSYESRSYDVRVHNASVESVTLWLTKDGDPFENGWLSPEEMAVTSKKNKDYIVSGVIVTPKKTASTGIRTGSFDVDTQAILRIYDGALKFNEVLAVGQDSPLRIDLALPPGTSNWRVTRNSKGMIEVRPETTAELQAETLFQPATQP